MLGDGYMDVISLRGKTLLNSIPEFMNNVLNKQRVFLH